MCISSAPAGLVKPIRLANRQVKVGGLEAVCPTPEQIPADTSEDVKRYAKDRGLI